MGTVAAPVATASVAPASGLSLADGWKVVDFTFSNSYTTNGEALTVPGFTTIDTVIITPSAIPSAVAGIFSWDQANQKIKAFVATTGVEVANAVNLSTFVLHLVVFGR